MSLTLASSKRSSLSFFDFAVHASPSLVKESEPNSLSISTFATFSSSNFRIALSRQPLASRV